MGQQVITELVIDANTSGADQFSQSMDKASASADKGVGSVAGLTLAVAGVSAVFIGSLAALRGFIDYVGNTNKELIDLAANAEKAGMTTKSFQETLFAAKASGLTDKDFVAGLDKIGADLQAASRGATDFGKLFEANGVSIKNVNGDLKTTQQAMGDISNLIKNAPTLQMATAIASIVGLSKDWVPFLRQGVDGIEAQKRAAADLGVTIDDNTIQKAKEFNNQWHTAIATWDLQFKASLASILPLLTQMASLASQIIDGVGSVSGNVSRWMTPDEDKSKQQLTAQQDDVLRLIELMTKAGDAAEGLQKLKITNLQGLLGLPEGASMAQAIALLDKLNALYDKAPTKLIVTPTGNGSTVLPPTGGDANDAVDRAINTLTRHIETQKADTLAVGLGAGALAGFRAEAAETAAVLANGGKETANQAAQFAVLKIRAQETAETLWRTKEGWSAFQNAAGPALLDFETGVKSGKDALVDFEKQFVRSLLNIINQILIFQPLAKALQNSLSGGINLTGFNPIAGVTGSAQGNVFDSGNVIPFARGGVIDSPSIVPMAMMAESGPEAIVPLRRGPDGNLGVASSGGSVPQITVNLIETPNGGGTTTQRQNANGGIDIEIAIAQISAKSAATPGNPLNRVLTDQFGSRQRLVSR